jgi:uncharacterized protein YkwD
MEFWRLLFKLSSSEFSSFGTPLVREADHSLEWSIEDMTYRNMILTVVLSLLLVIPVEANAQSGDPLTDTINGVRATYGLAALAYDSGLAGWAATNNQHQSSRGIGHYVMGYANRQNSAWNAIDCVSVVNMWMTSSGHRAAILDPGMTHCGGAMDSNRFWTVNFAVLATPILQVPSGQSPPIPSKQSPVIPVTPTPAPVVVGPACAFNSCSCQCGCNSCSCQVVSSQVYVKVRHRRGFRLFRRIFCCN